MSVIYIIIGCTYVVVYIGQTKKKTKKKEEDVYSVFTRKDRLVAHTTTKPKNEKKTHFL